jgi:hypothetical protein
MTSVEWLFKNLKSHFEHDGDLLEVVKMSFEQAKEIHKQEIIDAWYNGYINQSPIIYLENCGEQFYQEIFVSKGSDATSFQTTSDKWKEYQDWLNNKID